MTDRATQRMRAGDRRRALLASTSLIAALAAATAPHAEAQTVLPTHGSVASGSAAISQSGSAMTVNQTSSRAVINWNSFSIGGGDSVTFVQPNASAATLNRVTGSTTTSIAGSLNANGQVYLVNPNGIAITRGGAVSVGGGFVASTLNISDQNFNNGNLRFNGNGASAAVSNVGAITAAPGGFVGLLGGSVSNSGMISAPIGKVGLGSGEQATLDLTGDGFLQVALPTSATTADGKALIDVSGAVKAAGGTVAMKAATATNAVRNAINLSGYASARSAHAVGGSIVLGGGDGGDVKVSGKLDASGQRGGGAISVTGHNVALNNAKLSVHGAAGKGGAANVAGTGAVALAKARIDASGATDGGKITVGGGATRAITIDSGSTLRADALTAGDGGSIAVRSGGATTVAGLLTARGGAVSGNGGEIETSGLTAALNGISVDTSAAHGLTGTWLIDPVDFTIAASGGDITGQALSNELASNNITIKSSDGGTGINGDINVNDPVTWSTPNTLTLDAYRNVNVNANITIGGAGTIAFIYGDQAQNGVGSEATGNVVFAMSDSAPVASLLLTGTGAAVTMNGANYTFLRTEADLALLTTNPAGDFALAGDITLTQTYPNDVVADFYGKLDGLGHTISGLKVTQTGGADNVGFVGLLNADNNTAPAGDFGRVSNVFFSNVSVTGGTATGVGAVAGTSYGLVSSVGVSGTLTGSGADIGGLVGNNFGLVRTGLSSVVVNQTSLVGDNVGGVVGLNNGAVDASTASGAVQGDTDVGGLVGQSSGYVNGGTANFVTGNAEVGGVVGQNNIYTGDAFHFRSQAIGQIGQVNGAFMFGQVTGSDTVGGVVGLNAGHVILSFANGPVGGGDNIGGLVGRNTGDVSTSYEIGAVQGGTDVGGLVGVNTGSIEEAFAMGAVIGTTDVGGLVGMEGAAGAASSITDSYSTGAVFASTAGAGGLIGVIPGGANNVTTDAYWDTQTSGQATSAGGAGHTTAELQGGLTLPFTTTEFAGGAAGGAAGVYPYLTDLFPDGVRAISGFAYKDSTALTPLVSGASGVATVYEDFSTADGDRAGATNNPGTTGANGYYYIFQDPSKLTTGANVVLYTPADAGTGATNGATYVVSSGANNQTNVTIFGQTFFETTALPTYSGLVAAVASATDGDVTATNTIAGVSYINIAASNPAGFTIDTAISTTAELTIESVNTTLDANVTATGGVGLDEPVTLGASVTIDSGAKATFFGGAIDGSATAAAGLTVDGPVTLSGDVTTANGALVFNGAVTVNGDLTINSGTAATTFGSTIDSGATLTHALTEIAGAFSFGGAIGGQFSMGALSLTSAAGVTLPSIDATSILAHTTASGAGVTLSPGAVLTAFGDGTAVTLAAAGAFTNNSGAGAIVLTGGPSNWLIYSNNPAADVFGGLNSNNQAIWNTPYPAAAPPTTGDFYLFAFQPTVTFTSINGAKTYGQDATAAVAQDFTVSGIQPGIAGAFLPDTAATAYSGAPSVTSAGAAATATVAGGPYAINAALGSLAALNGYALAFASNGVLSVDAEAITIAASANTKTYDSTTTAAALPTLTSGTLYDQATLSETYASANAGNAIQLNPAIAFANAAAATNYIVTLAPAATGVINPEAITVTAAANTKTYDSTPAAAALPTLTTGVLYDTATLSETYATPNAASGIQLNPAIAFANAAAANNYAITLAPTETGVINPEPITITATPFTKVFDGTTAADALPTLTNGVLFDPATLSETFASPQPSDGVALIPAIAFTNPGAANNYAITLAPTGATPPNTGVILGRPIIAPVNLSPSVFVDGNAGFEIPAADSACGVELQLPDPATFSDPVAAINAISATTKQYIERCRDISQQEVGDALDRYADALEIIIEKLPPKLRQQLRHIPAIVHAAAVRARAAPTRVAAVRVLHQAIAQVHREIMLVRADDPDDARIRTAVSTGVSGVLNSAALALTRAEGI